MPIQNDAVEELIGPVTGEEPILRSVPLHGGARLAVTVQLALEAWAGTEVSGNTLGSPLSQKAIAMGVPDWATISAQHYGGRTGLWRILKALSHYGVQASCSVSGLAAQVWPDLVKTISNDGHEIVGHGLSQDHAMSDMDEAEDFDVVKRSTEILEEVAGQRPVGWSSHGSRRGNFTVLSLMKCGYLYTNDFRDADVPYVVAELQGQKLVSLPRTDEINDMFLFRRSGNPPSAYFEYFKRSFDQLYIEGSSDPKVMSCVAHGTLIGRPWGIRSLAECLEYASRFPDVWITTRRQLAEHYLSTISNR